MNINKNQIALLFKNVYRKNKTAKSLSLWLKAKGLKGWSETTITNTRKKPCSPKKELDLIKHLNNYLQFLENDKAIEPTKPIGILDIYPDQTFYLYHYGYDDDTMEEQILRQVLRIDNDLQVRLENIPHLLATDYTGVLRTFKKESHLIFTLHTAIFQEKLLELVFIRPFSDAIPKIMVGGYIYIDIKGAIKLGTVILYHLEKGEIATSMGVKYDSKEYDEIPEPIRDFLKEKKYNRLKITTGIYSLKDLENFLLKQKSKKGSDE